LAKSDEEYVSGLFPLLKQIQDDEIRTKVARVWMNLLRKSNWRRIEDLPFPRHPPPAWYPKTTLVKHSNDVALMARTIAEIAMTVHSMKINLDYVVAASVLHDAGNVLEYGDPEMIPEPDRPLISDIRRYLPHSFATTAEALSVGLPIEIVHAIHTHATESTKPPMTVEAVIVRYADMVVDDIVNASHKRDLLLTIKLPFLKPGLLGYYGPGKEEGAFRS
jgi:23S rRNA maturation-related 3'-5' exoribonuclease YhaM